jgi:MFS superfamily sulfate permease-like transporter
MNQKRPEKSNFKTLLPWVAFGIVMTFSTTILILWITTEIVNPIPMSILIGALVGVAFKLFSDALNRENKPKKGK